MNASDLRDIAKVAFERNLSCKKVDPKLINLDLQL
jgi:hypothetical protein